MRGIVQMLHNGSLMMMWQWTTGRGKRPRPWFTALASRVDACAEIPQQPGVWLGRAKPLSKNFAILVGEMSRGLGPGDEAQFVCLHQERMRGHHPHAEAVGAALSRGNASLVNVSAVA